MEKRKALSNIDLNIECALGTSRIPGNPKINQSHKVSEKILKGQRLKKYSGHKTFLRD
jgi:hypothetical protein